MPNVWTCFGLGILLDNFKDLSSWKSERISAKIPRLGKAVGKEESLRTGMRYQLLHQSSVKPHRITFGMLCNLGFLMTNDDLGPIHTGTAASRPALSV